jgi:hypothetical protein
MKSVGTVVDPEDSCWFLGHHDVVSIEVSGNDRLRRVASVAARSGDRLLSEPTAGTQPCRQEPLFMLNSAMPELG